MCYGKRKMVGRRFNNLSIRLRLSLIYSVILGLTLIIFGIIVFIVQVQITFTETEQTLARRAAGIAEFLHSPPAVELPPPPMRVRNNAGLQLRDFNGNIIDHPFSFSTVELPLSPEGLAAVQRGETWLDGAETELGLLLVHSQVVQDENDQPLIIQLSHSLEDRRQFLDSMRTILLIGSAVAVLIAFGIGWVLAGWTLRPINRITHTAQAIGTERDFERRVDYDGPNDEIGQLATTFNGMLTELQAAYVEKEQALQTQRQFVADASHELRTPLTTIRGNLGLLQRDPPIEDEDRIETLADMVDETERLIRLVNDLLVLARADTDRKLQCEPVSIKQLTNELCHQYQILIPARHIRCECLSDATALGDRDAIKQVLIIILDNAIKHTGSDTKVVLTTAVVNQQVNIKISDDGPGIEPEHVAHIFKRFYQADPARTSTGSGLGLAIAKELIERQQGFLTVESQVGQGTTFTIALPLSTTALSTTNSMDRERINTVSEK